MPGDFEHEARAGERTTLNAARSEQRGNTMLLIIFGNEPSVCHVLRHHRASAAFCNIRAIGISFIITWRDHRTGDKRSVRCELSFNPDAAVRQTDQAGCGSFISVTKNALLIAGDSTSAFWSDVEPKW